MCTHQRPDDRQLGWKLGRLEQPVGAAIADYGAASSGAWVEYDVSSVVKTNATYNFILISTTSDKIQIASRESLLMRPPALRITTLATHKVWAAGERVDCRAQRDDLARRLVADH